MEEEKFPVDELSDNPELINDGNDDPSADYEVLSHEIIQPEQVEVKPGISKINKKRKSKKNIQNPTTKKKKTKIPIYYKIITL